MDAFERRLAGVDIQKLEFFLRSLAAPCYESELLKTAFDGIDISRATPLELYHGHFILFHVLYRLRDEFYKEEKYLHIHFMRTFLADYPGTGKCRFYLPQTGQFCNGECLGESCYCDFHGDKIGQGQLDELSEKYFYMDTQNFYSLDEKTAEAFLNGTWEILAHYGEFEKSFETLGLPRTSDIKMIRNKFRELAKKYHPDMGESSHDRFNEINRAYRLLMRILPVMPDTH